MDRLGMITFEVLAITVMLAAVGGFNLWVDSQAPAPAACECVCRSPANQ